MSRSGNSSSGDTTPKPTTSTKPTTPITSTTTTTTTTSTAGKSFPSQIPVEKLEGSGVDELTIGIVRARWNGKITTSLADAARNALLERYKINAVVVETVPGSFELPFGALTLVQRKNIDCVIAIGCLIKGDTSHFDVIAAAVTQGLLKVSLDTKTPVVFGVLTCHSVSQAEERAGLSTSKSSYNLGDEWASTAVEMALLSRKS